jgi:hypothetical protein
MRSVQNSGKTWRYHSVNIPTHIMETQVNKDTSNYRVHEVNGIY